jgi:hypothetical protein
MKLGDSFELARDLMLIPPYLSVQCRLYLVAGKLVDHPCDDESGGDLLGISR